MKRFLVGLVALAWSLCSCGAKEPIHPIAASDSICVQSNALASSLDSDAFVSPQRIVVYITRSGKKYHSRGCRYLAKSCIEMDLDRARRSYSPCSKCNPP